MTESQITAQLEELRKHAQAIGLNLFAVLQTETDTTIESEVSNCGWNDLDDYKVEVCESLDLNPDDYDVIVVVASIVNEQDE